MLDIKNDLLVMIVIFKEKDEATILIFLTSFKTPLINGYCVLQIINQCFGASMPLVDRDCVFEIINCGYFDVSCLIHSIMPLRKPTIVGKPS